MVPGVSLLVLLAGTSQGLCLESMHSGSYARKIKQMAAITVDQPNYLTYGFLSGCYTENLTSAERTDWISRRVHMQLVSEALGPKGQACDLLFVGDSILETLRGSNRGYALQNMCDKMAKPYSPMCQLTMSIDYHCDKRNKMLHQESARAVLNRVESETGAHTLVLARGGDSTHHVSWRLQNGELPSMLRPRVIFMLAGINDLEMGSVADAQNGIQALLQQLQKARPASRIVLHALLPHRRINASILEQVNHFMKGLADGQAVTFMDCSGVFHNGSAVNETLIPDDLHPNRQGHEAFASCYIPLLQELLAAMPLLDKPPDQTETQQFSNLGRHLHIA